jgi:hypothetical protein
MVTLEFCKDVKGGGTDAGLNLAKARNLSRGSEEKEKEPHRGQSISQPRYEPGITRVQSIVLESN